VQRRRGGGEVEEAKSLTLQKATEEEQRRLSKNRGWEAQDEKRLLQREGGIALEVRTRECTSKHVRKNGMKEKHEDVLQREKGELLCLVRLPLGQIGKGGRFLRLSQILCRNGSLASFPPSSPGLSLRVWMGCSPCYRA
jgi:hypothetical protein